MAGPFTWEGLLRASATALGAFPSVAAGGAASPRGIVLDFETSGVLSDLLGKSLGAARGFLFLSAFLAYLVEAFGRSPTAERDYGAVTWRLVVVLFLLWHYQAVFGGVIALVDRLEQEVAPESTWRAFVTQVADVREALERLSTSGAAASAAARTQAAEPAPASPLAALTYGALIACVELVAEALVFLVNWLSRILTATLFILGPLALVAGIPRTSRTGTRWFLRFVTVASWPVFSGVVLSVLVTLGAQGGRRESYLECLVAALVLLVAALSTPALASQVIGGAVDGLAPGVRILRDAHLLAARPAWRAASRAMPPSGSAAGRVPAAARGEQAASGAPQSSPARNPPTRNPPGPAEARRPGSG